jgi:CheY-like chemotaxis protein
VHADETRIEQIVTNLIGNALKFTPKGGRIDVSVTTEGRDGVLCVRDNGIGMASELLPKIFDLFVQADRSIDRPLGGLGLGLTLVRRLTEMHGGAVAVASDGPGHGASFTIRLPRIAAPAARADQSSSPRATEPKRILVVEDNADAREMLRAILELQGHEVHEAVDGPAAIEQMRTVRPHVAIIDIGLPGMDGYTVARTIREDQVGQAPTRLIALTGYGTDQDRQRAADVGFDAHLTKPVEPERLQALLD